MKRIVIAIALTVIVALMLVTPALAAPNQAASHVAQCATTMGGQHVAQCAQQLEQGVSTCARAE